MLFWPRMSALCLKVVCYVVEFLLMDITSVYLVTFGRHVWQYKILLVHLYSHLGILSLAYEWYKALDVKNILMETVSHHILPQMLVSPLWAELNNLLKDYLKFMDNHFRESTDLTFLAYRHRNYSKVDMSNLEDLFKWHTIREQYPQSHVGRLISSQVKAKTVNQTAYENFHQRYADSPNPFDKGILSSIKELLFVPLTTSRVDFRAEFKDLYSLCWIKLV